MHGGGDGGGLGAPALKGIDDLGGGLEGVEAVGEGAEAAGRGAREAERARDRERPAAVRLLQGPERLEGKVEGFLVVARGLLALGGLEGGEGVGGGLSGRRRIGGRGRG